MRILVTRIRSSDEFHERYLSVFEHGGLFHPTREALPLGQYVVLDIRYPSLRDKLLIRGMVAWRRAGRRRTGVRAGIGVEFLPAEQAKHRYLLEVIANDVPDSQGQRRFRRLPTGLRVDWRVPDQTQRRLSRLDDIGPGGAFIVTDDRQPLGTPVVLEVVPPGSTAPIAIEGRVAWVGGNPGAEGIGVQFRWRDAGGLRRLKELVRRIESSDAPVIAS
jgi:Tfp pilus assembly protein PilZ